MLCYRVGNTKITGEDVSSRFENTPHNPSETQHRHQSQHRIPELFLDGLPGYLAWTSLIIAIILSIFQPIVALTIAAIIGVYIALRFVAAGIANTMGLRRIRQWEQVNWHEKYLADADEKSLHWDDVCHLVIIPNYNEPVPVLRRTLDNLKQQYEAEKRLIILMAMEAGEKDCQEKAEQLQQEYTSSFAYFFYTIHPRGLPGELQSKSANESWAAKWFLQEGIQQTQLAINNICVTTLDADTRFHSNYFFALTYWFAIDQERYYKFWQSPIRYHGNIWEINPLMRIVNAYATAFELAYLAAPWWQALPMSSYSLSLRLLKDSGNWDTDVIADEWHMYIKAYFANGGNVHLGTIFLPFLADATGGDTLWEAIKLRAQQTLRHAWGSKEVGYTITQIIENPDVPRQRGLKLLFRIAHDILLASSGWILVTVGSQLPVILHPGIVPIDIQEIIGNPNGIEILLQGLINNPLWLVLSLLGLIIVVLGFIFWLQDVSVRPSRNSPFTIRERILTILSFPLLPILTVLVVALPTLVAQTRLMLGIPLQFVVTAKE